MTYERVLAEQIELIRKERVGADDRVVNAAAEERAQWIYLRWKCRTDLYFLATEILGFKDIKNRVTGRRRIDEKLHRRMAEELSREEDTLQLYPRLTMKSAWLKAWVVQRILIDPNVRVGFWSKTASLVMKELAVIKAHFCNPKLLKLFPDIVYPRKSWEKDTQNEFCMKREEGTIVQESQVEVWGVDATVTGHHYDYQVYDDILDQDTVRTAAGIEKLLDWYQYMQAIKDVTAIEKVVGTRYHLQDLYGYIIHERVFEPRSVAIVSIFKNHGTQSNYSFYTMPELMRLKKKMGAAKFSAQMENKPVAEEGRIFSPPYPLYDVAEIPKNRKYYISVDPAATATQTSDETGICVAFVDTVDPSKAYFKEAYGVKKKPNELVDELISKIVQYRPFRVGIETGLQTALQALIDIKIREWEGEHNEFIRPHFVPISTGKIAKSLKLERTIGAMLKDRRALLPGRKGPDGGLEPASEMARFIMQMDLFNPYSDKNDDNIVDAAGMMFQTIEHFSPAHWFNVKNSESADGFTMRYIRDNFCSDNRTGWEKKFVRAS